MKSGWLQYLQQNMRLVVVFAFVGMSFLQWALRKLREQQKISEMKRAEQQRRQEALRTGRPLEPSADALAREQQLREAALIRQRQLEELRRRQAEMAKRAAATGAGQPKVVVRLPTTGPTSSGPIVAPPRMPGPVVGTPAPRRPAVLVPQPTMQQPRPAGAGQGRGLKLNRGPKQAAGARQAKPAQQRSAPKLMPSLPSTLGGDTLDALRPAAGAGQQSKTAPRPGGVESEAAHLVTMSAAEQWRRAIVMIEALSPPLSLRRDSGLGASRVF